MAEDEGDLAKIGEAPDPFYQEDNKFFEDACMSLWWMLYALQQQPDLTLAEYARGGVAIFLHKKIENPHVDPKLKELAQSLLDELKDP